MEMTQFSTILLVFCIFSRTLLIYCEKLLEETQPSVVSCLIYQFINGSECENCSYSCESCIGQGLNMCTTCSDLNNRELTGQSCPCKNTYFELNQQSTCNKCHQLCNNCYGFTSNECLNCNTGFVLFKNTCICPNQYFLNQQIMECQKCHYSCENCNGPLYTDCIKCSYDSLRVLNTGQCLCQDGYFDAIDIQICQKCSEQCQTCDNYSNCLSCQSDKILTSGQCECGTQKYMQQIGMTLICQNCHIRCDSCIGSLFYQCLSCPVNSQLIDNVCYCNNGYFYLNDVCTSCDSNCNTCIYSSTQCLTCNSNFYLTSINTCCDQNKIMVNNVCVCPPNTYEILGQCFGCPHSNCDTCDNANCLTCIDQIYFGNDCSTSICSIGNCNKCDFSGTCIECIATYNYDGTSCTCTDFTKYEDSGQCINCSDQFPNCNQCTIMGCTQCDQYFCVDGTGCSPCIANCNICATPSACSTCKDQYYGTNCDTCHQSCLQCSGNTINDCTACKSNANQTTTPSQCSCVSQYYMDTNYTCQQCSSICDGCTTSQTNCQNCYTASQNRILDTNNNCVCNNSAGYEDVGLDICYNIQCGYGCSNCNLLDYTCSSCLISGTNRINDSSNQCPCNDGYYELNSANCFCKFYQILECPYNCSTCLYNLNDSAPYCVTCKINREKIPICSCVVGYYESGQDCIQCPLGCYTCTSNDFCTSCQQNYALILEGNSQTCKCQLINYKLSNCSCQTGYYLNNALSKCLPCDFKCKECQFNSNNCTICNEKYYNEPNCICSPGFYESENECLPCQSQCSKCTSATNCQDCPSMLVLYQSQCVCQQNFYNLPDSYDCIQCSPQCLECQFNADNCLICNYNRINPQICICPDGYYEISTNIPCNNCSIQCLTCVTSNDNCLSCAEHRGFPPTCVCLNGYFEDTNKICQICHYKCITCQDTYDNCTACISSTKSTPNCECQDGYYLDEILQQCMNCNSRCLTCNGPNEYNCITCDQTKLLNLVYSKCICQSGYYYQEEQCNVCSIEIQICQTNYCGDGIKQKREECDDWNNNNRDGCSSDCKLESDYYCTLVSNFQLHSTILYTQCVKCPVYCSSCILSKCIKCYSGYFISTTYDCQQCNSHCAECTGSLQKDCTVCKTGIDYGFKEKCAFCEDTIGLYTNNYKCVSKCGDGIKKTDEMCDDGNITNNDGCSSKCIIEEDYSCSQQENTLSSCYKQNKAIATVEFDKITNFYQATRTGNILFSKPLFISNISLLDGWTQKIENVDISYYNITSIPIFDSDGYLIQLSLTINYLQQVETNIYLINFSQYLPRDAIDNYEMKTQYIEQQQDKYLKVSTLTESTTKTSQKLGTIALFSLGGIALLGLLMGSLEFYWNVLDNLQILSYISFINVNFPYLHNQFLSIFDFARFQFTDDYVSFDFIQNINFENNKNYPLIVNKNVEYNFIINFSSILIIWMIPLCILTISKFNIFVFKQIHINRISDDTHEIKQNKENNFIFTLLKIIYFIQKFSIKYVRQFFYFIILRIYISSLYDLNFSIFTAGYCWLWNDNPNLVDKISYYFSISLIFIQFGVAVLLAESLTSQKYEIKSQQFELQYGSLYEGINSNKYLNRQVSFFQPIRKMLFMGSLILFYDQAIYQITLLISVQFLFTIIQIGVRPYINNLECVKGIIQDIGLSVSLSLILFYYFQDHLHIVDQNIIEKLSYIHVGIYITMLCTCLFIDLYQQIKIIINKYPYLKQFINLCKKSEYCHKKCGNFYENTTVIDMNRITSQHVTSNNVMFTNLKI